MSESETSESLQQLVLYVDSFFDDDHDFHQSYYSIDSDYLFSSSCFLKAISPAIFMSLDPELFYQYVFSLLKPDCISLQSETQYSNTYRQRYLHCGACAYLIHTSGRLFCPYSRLHNPGMDVSYLYIYLPASLSDS